MAVVKELIRTEENGTISFGDYEKNQKSKVSDYPHQGDMYKVKTFKEITKLERNGMFVYEGPEDAQITVELEAEAQYEVYLDGASTGKMETNLGGKLSFSVELGNGSAVDVKIVKC